MGVLNNKMRLRLTLTALLAILLLGARDTNVMVMTLINKSGMPIAVSLLAQDLSRAYYLTFPEGDKTQPFVTRFTVEQGVYRMRVFYLDAPAYQNSRRCVRSRTAQLIAGRNMRVVVGPCDQLPPTRGEPTMYKFGRWRCME